VVLTTSVSLDETPADGIDMVVSDTQGLWRVRTPRLDLAINGAGDAVAALFFVHWLKSGEAASALENAAASIYGLLKRTAEAGSREILTVAAQDEFVSPSHRFAAEPL
jgi:pyridoxine kinase